MPCALGAALWVPRAAGLACGARSLFSVFLVGGVCCVCFGCCGGGCGLAAGAVALPALLRCRVASLAVVVRGRCLPVVAFLFAAGVAGSPVASRLRALPLGGSAVRGVVVVVAGVGFPALLLGACRSVPVGFVGCVAGWRVACAPSRCCFSALRFRAGFRGGLLGARLFFMRRRKPKQTFAAC